MLTDTALRNLKPKPKTYKAFDRDGMYVTVSPVGTVTFRYDYRLNGRRETLTIGRYGPAGISLALAREKLIDAKKAVAQGKSPALEKGVHPVITDTYKKADRGPEKCSCRSEGSSVPSSSAVRLNRLTSPASVVPRWPGSCGSATTC